MVSSWETRWSMAERVAREWVGRDDTSCLGQVEFGVLVGMSIWIVQ